MITLSLDDVSPRSLARLFFYSLTFILDEAVKQTGSVGAVRDGSSYDKALGCAYFPVPLGPRRMIFAR
jgi:hypothetical protein